jgi:DNA-binding SARP family transcriptional activator
VIDPPAVLANDTPPGARWVFTLFGGLRVELDGGDLTGGLPGRQGRTLVAYLVLNRERSVSRDELLNVLWPSRPPVDPQAALGSVLAKVRHTLGADAVSGRGPLRMQLAPGAVLDVQTVDEQSDRAEHALADGDPAAALAAARRVLDVLQQRLLPDMDGDWIETSRRSFDELAPRALDVAARASLALGERNLPAAERFAAALVEREPYREAGYALLMRAQAQQGNVAEALQTFERVRALLRDELGAVPSAELLLVHEGLLRGDGPRTSTTVAAAARDCRPVALPAPLVAAATDAFVGRAADLERLVATYEEAASGTRRLVLLSGEPGVGKTRLVAQFAKRAHLAGAIVLYGRCDAEALLAQQPFVEAVRRYVRSSSHDELASRLRLVGRELQRIVPEIADEFPDLPKPLAGDPEGARSRLFEAVSSMLCEAASCSPVVLVLDDLHWADTPTLLLLKYLVRDSPDARVMVLGTFRETELDPEHPLCAAIAELRSQRLVQRWALTALDAAEVSELVSVHVGAAAPPELRKAVYERTEGNAFFVVEVLRHLTESGKLQDATAVPTDGLVVPDGVTEVILQRLARLGQPTTRVLATAAVIGRAFELDVLRRVTELVEDDVLDMLETAVRARVLDEAQGVSGHFSFSHALIRDTLYRGLGPTRRAMIHGRVATVLEQSSETHLVELAHHFAHAGAAADLGKAIEYGSRAGEHAITQLAYEQAAAHFRATAALIGTGRPELRRPRCDLVIAQGEAERQAGDPAYRATLLEAARLAQDLQDPDRLARAALANNRGFISSAWGVDGDRVAVLEAALAASDDVDSPTRAALLALLALELVTDGDWRRRDRLSDAAVAMARRVGHPQTLALVLTQRAAAQWRPQRVPELRADLREAGALAIRHENPLLAGHAAYLGAHAAMEAGDLDEADELLARLAAVAEQLAQPVMRWYDVVARGKRLAISGPPEEAERLAFAGMELGVGAGQPDAMGWFLDQLWVARFLQGTLGTGEPCLPDSFPKPGSSVPIGPEITATRTMPLIVGATMSVVLCETGRLEEARAHFELLMSAGLDDLPQDYAGLVIPANASLACARLADKHSAGLLHAILEPHSDRFVNTGASWSGATTHYLGLLAATLDRLDEADARFAAAERSYLALDAQPWLARLRSDWAAALLSRGQADDFRRAERFVEQSLAYTRPPEPVPAARR